MTVQPLSATELLDLDGVGQRSESVRFDVLDPANHLVGVAAVSGERAPVITNDVDRSIRRTLDGLELPPRPLVDADSTLLYAEDINTVTDRIRPVWVLGAGGSGYEFNLGIFLFGDASTRIRTLGDTVKATLVDQCLLLDQRLAESVGYSTGQNIQDALEAQADAAGVVSTSIDAPTATVQTPAAWVAGRDSRLRVMEDLCLMAGFLPPYFDNDGTLICRSAPDLSTATPDVTYATGSRIIDGTVLESSDLLDAPNRYVALDTSGQNGELVGIFDIPAAAPNSYANRGFYVVAVSEIQGLTDQTAAEAAAAAAYASDSSTYTWLAFESTPDPRHDTFDVVSVGGVNYRELGWRLPLKAGSQMDHDCRGLYQT